MRYVVKSILLFVPLILLSGCMIFNPSKRTELTEMHYPGEVHISTPLVIDISKSTAQIPVEEAVWTNKGGPYHIPEESRTIGFSQNYQFVPFPGGATVVNTGSVLVVPFGRIFAETLHAAIAKTLLGAVCTTQACLEEAARKYPEHTIVTVAINDFHTWETPFNRINFESKIDMSCMLANGSIVTRSVTAADKDMSIGHMFHTGYGLTANMRDIAKKFGVKVVELVLRESTACLNNTKEAMQR